MSTEKTDAIENTEDISTAGDGEVSEPENDAAAETPAEEKQTPAETVRKETAAFDVAENDESEAAPQDTDASDEAPEQTIKRELETDGEAGTDTQTGQEEAAAEEPETEPETDPETDPETEEIKEIKKRIRERKKEKKRKARRRKTVFWTAFSIIALTVAGFIFSLSGFFTVDSIEVQGNSHFTSEEIINIAHAVPGHNLLYNPGSKTITDYLEQNPYIKSASVLRKLPSTLVIVVEEREEAISFNYDDDYLIMDDEGILLKKTRTEPKVTSVSGLVVTKLRLGDTVGTENQQMFSRLLRLVRAMKAADMYFVSIDMTGYEEDMSVKAYIYDKLVVKTDYESLVTNLKNGRLHKIVEKLFEDDIRRGTITFGEDGSASFEPGI
ncbi:MAG: FtsQ-type POTRA domain-containing protein [Mogibacterium sp.]|nr:FtsQ-type POTRA domain-containing protein [Mogibacterium sp.]